MNSYKRRETRLDVLAGALRLRVTSRNGLVMNVQLAANLLEQAATVDPSMLRTVVASLLPSSDQRSQEFEIERMALDVHDRASAAINWESLVGGRVPVVRVCDVRARVRAIPLTFPLRVLESGGAPVVQAALDYTFRNADRSLALLNAVASAEKLVDFPSRAGWRTVEVLHLRDGGLMATPDGRLQAWLEPFLDRYQTRLVVAESSNDVQARSLRVASQALVERAGPAVWVLPATSSLAMWQSLYAGVAHDRPLDWIAGDLALSGQPAGALFVGGAREELLRYSKLGASVRASAPEAMPLARRVARGAPRVVDPPLVATVRQALQDSVERAGLQMRGDRVELSYARPPRLVRFGAAAAAQMAERGVYAPGVEAAVMSLRQGTPTLDELARTAVQEAVSLRNLSEPEQAVARALGAVGRTEELEFEDHESDGMLPMAERMAAARGLARQFGGLKRQRQRASRHVNVAFFRDAHDASLERSDQRLARLRPGDLVHLGIQIGARDEMTVTLGSAALVEEVDRAKATLQLEIGVTGLDFEVVGDPVQQLLLEPGHPSTLVTFAVRPTQTPTVSGVARLRVSLFRDNHLVQSFIVAAVLEGHEPHAGSLALALGAPVPAVRRLLRRSGPVGYLQRLEFTMASAADAARLPRRGLSLVANDSGGEKVITLKARDLFHVARSADFAEHAQALRKALDDLTVNRIGAYGYMHGGIENAGDPARLVHALWPLASAGWSLCSALVPNDEDREALRVRLLEDGGLQAAHIVASDVIPWSLVYDRPLRSQIQVQADGSEMRLCRAGIPKPDEAKYGLECGQRPECLLHQAQGGAPAQEDEVLCPLRFWGFRVPIEVPAHQKEGVAGRALPPLRTIIQAATPLRFAAVLNPHLKQAADHSLELQSRLAPARAALVQAANASAPTRKDVMELLAKRDLDLVYLYCHGLARTAAPGGAIGPGLDFGRAHETLNPVLADLIPAEDLGRPTWANAPLVFMNGCSTAGFSTYAPSRLVLALVQGRRAAAVVGTEVTIWEVLAREFALLFFEAFIDRGQPAGAALLAARRTLLAKNNPLGLVYTLYGSSALGAALLSYGFPAITQPI